MDQVKIGRFIQTIRKEQKLTQREVAEKLSISDKTVSKWETGNGLPEVSLMLPLCGILGISVNELLSGERLDEKQYYQKAEENIMTIMKEKEEAKKKIVIAAIVTLITLVSSIALIMVSGLTDMEIWMRFVLIGIALLDIILGIAIACVLEREAGVYECRKCGEKFVPTMTTYIMGIHGLTWRRLRCPKCGQKSNCKKHLSK